MSPVPMLGGCWSAGCHSAIRCVGTQSLLLDGRPTATERRRVWPESPSAAASAALVPVAKEETADADSLFGDEESSSPSPSDGAAQAEGQSGRLKQRGSLLAMKSLMFGFRVHPMSVGWIAALVSFMAVRKSCTTQARHASRWTHSRLQGASKRNL